MVKRVRPSQMRYLAVRFRPIAGIIFSTGSVNQGGCLSATQADPDKLARRSFQAFILHAIPAKASRVIFHKLELLDNEF